MADFADKLRAFLGDRSQPWLAEASGVPQPTISAYLRRANRPSWQHVQTLARALGISCTELQDDDAPALPPAPEVKKRGRPPKSILFEADQKLREFGVGSTEAKPPASKPPAKKKPSRKKR